MALNFTDSQIKELSGQVLQGPTIIQQAEDTVVKTEQTKQDFLDLDDQNTVFTDDMTNVIDQFHKELKELTGIVKTLYNEANIDLAARLDPSNPHFPQPDWLYFYPKVLDSNKGLPTSTTVDLIEPDAINEIQAKINILLTGFSDGSESEDTLIPVSGGVATFDNNPGFNIGDRIVLLKDGGVTGASFGVVTDVQMITNPSPPPSDIYEVTYTVEFTAGSLPVGTTVSNFHNGFNNIQRETVSNNFYQNWRQDNIDSAVSAWKNIVLSIEGVLNANDSAADKNEINTEKSNIANTLNIINAWELKPNVGLGTGRFGDSSITPINNELVSRETRIADRIAEINASLGTLTQDLGAGKGKFAGDGRYFDYFTHLNARIHANDGTLRNYYGQDPLIEFATQQKDNTIAEVERVKDILQIKLLKADPDGSDTIEMVDISDLQVGQTIKFMDNVKPVLNYTIVALVPEERKIQLDGQTPTNYSLTQQARVVKVL